MTVTARTLSRLRRLVADTRGNMALETAIVAPVLVLLSLGSFEVSRMVARQHELQSGIGEAEAIALAANMGAQTNTTSLKAILKDSLQLDDNQITVTKVYRCNASDEVKSSSEGCDGSNDVLSTYVRVQLNDTYTPIWSHLGFRANFNYRLTRTVQLS